MCTYIRVTGRFKTRALGIFIKPEICRFVLDLNVPCEYRQE